MASGLVALLDDVAAIAKLAAASLDDVGAAAGKASSKAAGVVIDDTAVTPRYVTGLEPARELPIIWGIAKGSFFNKLVILLPVCIALSAFAPWALAPLLMIGGAYLCFEGAEKVLEWFGRHDESESLADAGKDPATLEREKISGAIRTDFILSAEIMAISLGEVAQNSLATQAVVLAVVAILITAGVYGVVALIVKMDDIGLKLAEGRIDALRAFGRGLVTLMPRLLSVVGTIGTLAMLWVGGGIILHGVEGYGLEGPMIGLHHMVERVEDVAGPMGAAAAWLVNAFASALLGLILGGMIAGAVHLMHRRGH